MDDFNSRDNFNDSTRAFVKVDSDVEEIERQDESYTPDMDGQHTSSYDGPIITSDQAAEARRGLENLQGMNLAPEILAAASVKLTGVLDNYQAQRNEVQDERDFEHTSLEEAYGGMTAADLQLRRLQGDSPSDVTGYSMGTRMAIKDLASDQFRSMNTYGVASIAELDAVRARAGNAMEISPHKFSQGLNIDASQIASKVTTKSGRTSREQQNYGRKEVIQAVKFFEGIGTNLDLGPGGRLNLHSGNEETDSKQRDDLEWAINYTARFADKVIHQDTKDSSIYEVRKEATQQAVLNRMLEGKRYNKPTKDGKYFMFDEKTQLPVPLDFGVPGLIDNLSRGGIVNGEFEGDSEFSQREFQQAVLTGSHSEGYLAAAEPSVERSLWPKPRGIKKGSPEETAYYQERRAAYEQEKEDWKRASAILNAQMTTNQNETDPQNKGKRWTGYDVDPEQEKRNALFEEAAMLDIDMVGRKSSGKVSRSFTVVATDTGFERKYSEVVQKGSDRAGRYRGGEDRSDRDDFIEAGMEYDPVKSFVGPMPIKQGTDAWKAQRKGNITASVIGRTTEELAINLANERLGNEEEFLSSGHVKEGNLYEDNVGRSFMHEHGERLGLTMKEAFFETNADLPGFGVSPDANLYDKDGKRSLLELKYLASDGTMDKSMKTYKEQLQLQMAVTGAKEAHFYRQNKRTGESAYDLVKADPELQAELIKRGQDAHELASTLDAIGVDDLKKKLASRKDRAADKEAGPATVMKTEEKAQAAKATVMDLSKAATNVLSDAISNANGPVSGDGSGVTSISKKEFGERLEREKNIANMKTYTENVVGMKMAQDAEDAEQANEAAKDAAKANKDMARASKEASANLKRFGSSLLQVAGAVAGVALEGNDTEMATQRIASETGMDAQRTEGMRRMLAEGGVKYEDTAGIMQQFGSLSGEAASFDTSPMLLRINDRMGKYGSLHGLPKLTHSDVYNKSGEALAEMITKRTNQLESPEARRDYLRGWGLSKMAPAFDRDNPNRITAEGMSNVIGDIDPTERFSINSAIESAADVVRQGKEGFSSFLGETGNSLAKYTTDAIVPGAAIAGGVVTAVGGGKLAVKALKAGGPRSVALGNTLGKAGSVLGKGIVRGGGAGLAIAGTRAVTGVEDDGGIADSLMDIGEFTAMGAAVGSMVTPGLGTAIGAGVGAVIGAGNEIYEWASQPSPDTIPSTSLGVASPQSSSNAGASLNSNVTVNVEVSPDGVQTTVNDNGNEYIDTSTTYSQD